MFPSRVLSRSILIFALVSWGGRSLAQDSSELAEQLLDGNAERLETLPTFSDYIDWSTDPFFQLPGFTQQSLDPPVLTLQGIMFDDENSSALINGRLYSIGAFAENHKIVDIGSNYVVLQYGRSLTQLTLPYYEQPVSEKFIEEVPEEDL